MNATNMLEELHHRILSLRNECERTEKLFKTAYVIETLTVRVAQVKLLAEVMLKIMETKS